tara:strand:- start:53 stop:832 length:780 start_codon:yes stop_codon:yes gene_type:complete
MVYAGASMGYEPGGVVASAPLFDQNNNPTLPTWELEEVTQFELGWKGSFGDGRGNFAIAAFLIDYTDRIFTSVVQQADGSLVEQLNNVGDSEQSGLELEVAVQATEYLSLSGAIGFLDAEWDDGASIQGVDVSGTTPSGAVDDGMALAANYVRPMANGMEFIFDLQFNYRGNGRSMQGERAMDMPDYHTINLATGIKKDGWQLMLHAENLTDEKYYHDIENDWPNLGPNGIFDDLSEPLIIMGTPGLPRLISVSASYRF